MSELISSYNKLEIDIVNEKRKLSNNDYKIIKCMELLLKNLTDEQKSMISGEYDIDALISERDNSRATINTHEELLSQLKNDIKNKKLDNELLLSRIKGNQE